LRPTDGWCDAPDDENYNRLVALPYGGHAEELWRKEFVYDLLAVIGYNDDPVIPGGGSAIFLHLAVADFTPTEGCVALAANDLESLLAMSAPGDWLAIDPLQAPG
jgi:L,D-peptidoglycan transpeptidase YkuD (ErfK/YbiS/YcfS/YnhG family)